VIRPGPGLVTLGVPAREVRRDRETLDIIDVQPPFPIRG
jgi:hypothetical protein